MLKATAHGFTLSLLVQPNGKKSEILGVHDDALKIRIQAPPVEGKANEVVVEFLADFFGVSRRHVTLLRGQQSRQKVVEVSGLSIEEAQRKIQEAV